MDLRPREKDSVKKNILQGTVKDKLITAKRQYLPSLGDYRGAYNYGDKHWTTGTDWTPLGIKQTETIAETDALANYYKNKAVEIKIIGLNSPFVKIKK